MMFLDQQIRVIDSDPQRAYEFQNRSEQGRVRMSCGSRPDIIASPDIVENQ